jgi:hypothetical protein
MSQAAGVHKKKEGVVVGIVPAGRRVGLANYVDGLTEVEVFEQYSTGPIDGAGLARDHESYLIAVEPGLTSMAKPRLYWPRVSGLKKVA